MKKISLVLAMGLATAGIFSCNSSGSGEKPVDSVEAAKDSNENKVDQKMTPVSEDDSKFLVFAADAGMTEVQAAKLAKNETVDAKVKDFADMMIKDHTAAGDEVKALAATKQVTLPDSISNDHMKAIADLGKKKGKDFQKSYVNTMVDDHQKVVDKFKDASQNCKDPEIKAFAVKTLPTLQGHLDHAKMLKDSLKL